MKSDKRLAAHYFDSVQLTANKYGERDVRTPSMKRGRWRSYTITGLLWLLIIFLIIGIYYPVFQS